MYSYLINVYTIFISLSVFPGPISCMSKVNPNINAIKTFWSNVKWISNMGRFGTYSIMGGIQYKVIN